MFTYVLTVAATLTAATLGSHASIPVPVLRDASRYSDNPVVREVVSRVQDVETYRDPNPSTWAHETAHGITSQFRNQYHRPVIYVAGSILLLNEPQGTLDCVAAQVPQSLRGATYHLYMVQQSQYWNRQPSYLLEEVACYLVGLRASDADNTYRYSLRPLQELMIYSMIMACDCQVYDEDTLTSITVLLDHTCGWSGTLRNEPQSPVWVRFWSSDEEDVAGWRRSACSRLKLDEEAFRHAFSSKR
jgi:hypothetical protein